MSKERFLEMESTPGEAAAMKIVEMATKDLEHYINLVDKAMARFERIDSNSESFTVSKMLQRNHSWKEEPINGADFIVLGNYGDFPGRPVA